jgi:hypothetical protein
MDELHKDIEILEYRLYTSRERERERERMCVCVRERMCVYERVMALYH